MNDTVDVEAQEDEPYFKYQVPVKTEVTGHIRVAAKNEAEAEEKAFNETPELCYQCSGGGPFNQHSIEFGEWEQDGDVEQVGDAKDEDDWEAED